MERALRISSFPGHILCSIHRNLIAKTEFGNTIRLFYTSTSRIQKNDPDQPLIKILDASTRNNPARGVTGLLMHGGGMFMQVLEGADDNVLRLYVKLLDDPRHTDCRVILVSLIEKRTFPEWAMAAMNVPDFEFHKIQEMLSHRHETVDPKLFSTVTKLFIKG